MSDDSYEYESSWTVDVNQTRFRHCVRSAVDSTPAAHADKVKELLACLTEAGAAPTPSDELEIPEGHRLERIGWFVPGEKSDGTPLIWLYPPEDQLDYKVKGGILYRNHFPAIPFNPLPEGPVWQGGYSPKKSEATRKNCLHSCMLEVIVGAGHGKRPDSDIPAWRVHEIIHPQLGRLNMDDYRTDPGENWVFSEVQERQGETTVEPIATDEPAEEIDPDASDCERCLKAIAAAKTPGRLDFIEGQLPERQLSEAELSTIKQLLLARRVQVGS